ncbi:hypothetical protein DFH27DRAFT_551707 [Peziza echinospora]|nr:hypothetical protein DFH27DRAFT_551707 [Peziza echinospora]
MYGSHMFQAYGPSSSSHYTPLPPSPRLQDLPASRRHDPQPLSRSRQGQAGRGAGGGVWCVCVDGDSVWECGWSIKILWSWWCVWWKDEMGRAPSTFLTPHIPTQSPPPPPKRRHPSAPPLKRTPASVPVHFQLTPQTGQGRVSHSNSRRKKRMKKNWQQFGSCCGAKFYPALSAGFGCALHAACQSTSTPCSRVCEMGIHTYSRVYTHRLDARASQSQLSRSRSRSAGRDPVRIR